MPGIDDVPALNSDGGFVQVLVLVSLLAISGIVVVAISMARQNADYAAVIGQSSEAELLADSAIRRVEVAIADPTDDLETRVMASPPYQLQVDGKLVDIEIQGEGGKIDPLTVDPAVLSSYLANAGLDGAQLATAISDTDSARAAANFAEAEAILFRSLLPIRTIKQLNDDLTAYGGSKGIDPLFADDRVLAAVPALGADGVEEVQRLRKTNPSALGTLSPFFLGSAEQIYTITATVRFNGAATFTKRVPIEISSSGRIIPLDDFL